MSGRGPLFCASKRLASLVLKPDNEGICSCPAFPSPCRRGLRFRRRCRALRRARPWHAGERQVAKWLQSRGGRLSCLSACCGRELGLLPEGQFHLPGNPYAWEPERPLLPQSQDRTLGVASAAPGATRDSPGPSLLRDGRHRAPCLLPGPDVCSAQGPGTQR